MIGIEIELANSGWVPPEYTIRRIGSHNTISTKLTETQVREYLKASDLKRWYTNAQLSGVSGLWVDAQNESEHDDVLIYAFLKTKGLCPTEKYPVPAAIDVHAHNGLIASLKETSLVLRSREKYDAPKMRSILKSLAYILITNMCFGPGSLMRTRVRIDYIQYVQDIVKEAIDSTSLKEPDNG